MPGTRDAESRARVLDLTVGFVEDLRRFSASAGPEGFCSDFQICLPYQGYFVWHVGSDDVVGDPNQVVFVRDGEAFRMSSRSDSGYAELIVTPEIGILSELAYAGGRPLFEHPLFKRRSIHATPRLQAARARFLHSSMSGVPREYLEDEETFIALLRTTLQHDGRRLTPATAATARVIRRTKELLNVRYSERLRLPDISRAVGISSAYLTDLFTRTEGISLHQYLTQLRLSRALPELPHANDLTALAFELGFSSHSHFTYAFRRLFGCTPSVFRERTRRESGLSLSRAGMCGLRRFRDS